MAKAKRTEKKLPSDKTALEIGAIFAAASLAIEKIVQQAVGSKRLGEDAYLRQQRAAILEVVSATQRSSAPLIASAIRSAYERGSGKALMWLAAFFGVREDQGFSKTDQAAVELIVQDTIGRLTDAASGMARQADTILKEAAMQQLQDVAAINVAGPKFNDAAELLESSLERAGVSKLGAELGDSKRLGIRLVRVAGKNWDAQKYSEMVIRTQTRDAHSRATVQRLLENDQDLVQITSHSTTCEICAEHDGQIYSITGASDKYPPLEENAPFHPNCQHLCTPYL